MKKLRIISVAIALIAFISGVSLACDLRITPNSFEAKVGEVVSFRLERYLTHRSCILPIEETKIIVTRGKIVDPGTWKKGTPDVLEFKVQFNEAGDATVRVERNCPKVGLITVEAKGKVTTSEAGVPMPPQKETPPPTPEVKEAQNPENTLTSTNLILWYGFFGVGVGAFLLKLTSYRTPLLFLSAIILGFYLGGCPEPVGTPFYLISGGQTLFGTALILFTIPVVLTFIVGRAFCGWICPLGAVQELIHRKESPLRCYHGLPRSIDRPLKWLKFLVLIYFGYLSWVSSSNAFSKHEPFKTLFNLSGSSLSLWILALLLLLSIFISRPFCRYVCPLGAILKIAGKLSYFKIKLDESSCVECGLCTKEGVCPVGAIECRPDSKKPIIDNGECIACLECKYTCRKSAIKLFP